VTGSDATGIRGREDRPFLTIAAAIAVAQAGDTVYLRPGTYTITAGIVVPVNVAIIGQDGNQCIINMVPTAATTMFTLNNFSRLSNFSATLGGNTVNFNLTGILFSGTSVESATVNDVNLTVNDSTATTAGTANVYGVWVNCTGVAVTAQTVQNLVSSTILVNSIGNGIKRGILVNNGGLTSWYNNIICNCAGNAVGAGATYIGVEFDQPTGTIISYYLGRKGYIQGTIGAFTGVTGADISQVNSNGFDTGTGILLDDEALYAANANGNNFTSLSKTSRLIWGALGALTNNAGVTSYMLSGQQSTFVTTATIAYASIEIYTPTVVQNLRVYCSSATTDVFTIYKNGVATLLSVIGAAGFRADHVHAVSFNPNDLLVLALEDVGGVLPANVIVIVELY
jgi:hypothetical protein